MLIDKIVEDAHPHGFWADEDCSTHHQGPK
jgi:hypothetical protein